MRDMMNCVRTVVPPKTLADGHSRRRPQTLMTRYDLHCHSRCSDGLLTPAEVVARAAARGVDVLALTDHDELAGLAEARAAAEVHGITLVDGAELSASWEGHTLHVIALHVDPAAAVLAESLQRVRTGRATRARRIADALAEAGIGGAYEGAMRYVTSERLVSRTHFARYLVDAGYVREVKDVFRRYLTPGKPGYVPHGWAALPEALRWIHAAGGQAVLAHPGRYKISPTAMRRLLAAFRDAGGSGIEILSSSHTAAQAAQFATLARVFGLRGSAGSDYHGPGESTLDLGEIPPLPSGVIPIWRDW